MITINDYVIAKITYTYAVMTYIQNFHTKTDERSQMKNDLLEAILHCKFGLTLMKQDLENFVPPVSMLKYDSSIYN